MPEEYITVQHDLTHIIAQFTCGIKGAIPEQADVDLADKVIIYIENELKKN